MKGTSMATHFWIRARRVLITLLGILCIGSIAVPSRLEGSILERPAEAVAVNAPRIEPPPPVSGVVTPIQPTGPGSVGTPSPVPTLPASESCPLPRRAHAKPQHVVYWQGLYRDRVAFKLQDDLQLTLTRGPRQIPAFTVSPGATYIPARLPSDLAALNATLAAANPQGIRPLFSTSAATLRSLRAQAEARSCRDLADLEQYYWMVLQKGAQGEAVADQLNRSPLVEITFLPPIPRDADKPPATEDFEPRQDYLDSADQGGIDARYAWRIPGGRGDSMRVVDVEATWNVNHEDLPRPFWFSGTPTVNEIATALNLNIDDDLKIDSHHGTAVAGMLVALDDSHGVTGIANAAEWGAVSIIRSEALGGVFGGVPGIHDASVSDAVMRAMEKVRTGDVILIEQHSQGPATSSACATNCDQFEYVPMEYFPDSFDAIETATASGVIVVEAAGNGSVDLDWSVYEGRFDRRQRDSGAILVGASQSNKRAPAGWSNYGSRVDVHAWGSNVMTTGYGNVRANGSDVDQFYTKSFGGTSSASPIVTGAALAIQGALKASGHGILTPSQMRDLLVRTGTPQTERLGRYIGPMPNLRAALGEFDSATESAGGMGGDPFTLRCPQGQALVGVSGRNGALIDQLRGICANPAGLQSETQAAGGPFGNAFERRCAPGTMVVGLGGRAGAYIDSLQLECVRLEDTGRRRNHLPLDSVGGGGGAVFGPNRCAYDRIAVGLRGRAGMFIDRLQLLCSAQAPSTAIETPWVSDPVGGQGGAAATLKCPEGSVLAGVSVTAGWWLDSIAPRCVATTPTGAWDGQPVTGARMGGGGGTPSTMTCPNNQAVSGIDGRANWYIDRLRLRCRALLDADSTTGRASVLVAVGGNGGSEFGRIDCPADLAATGFAVRTGAYVDQLKLICGH
jgi:serine protease